MTEALRVLLVDDHQLLVQSLALALRAEGFDVEAADLSDREQLIAGVQKTPPTLVLLDLELGGVIGDGSTLVRSFVEAGARVLVVSAATDQLRVAAALEQGAIGYVSKTSEFDVLVATARAAAHGQDVMSELDRHRLVTQLRLQRERLNAERAQFDRLTHRERQVLYELSKGKSVGTIAREWYVSEATVRTQVRGVLVKLGATTQLEAVAQAMRAGWLGAG
jgi:DNA-binding NarL/FixJ family response regulator